MGKSPKKVFEANVCYVTIECYVVSLSKNLANEQLLVLIFFHQLPFCLSYVVMVMVAAA